MKQVNAKTQRECQDKAQAAYDAQLSLNQLLEERKRVLEQVESQAATKTKLEHKIKRLQEDYDSASSM